MNQEQRIHFTDRIINYIKDNSVSKISIWGLAFKPETDDIREAPSIYLIKELLNHNIKISVYDPKAMLNFNKYFDSNKIEYCNHKYEAIRESDMLILLTEWQDFRSPDFHDMKKNMNNPVIFDGRNIYSYEELCSFGFRYFQIGVKDEY